MNPESTASELRKTGISVIGGLRWGTHFCCFYETKQDLLDTLVPYFKAGLENNEFCLWVVSPPLSVDEAKHAFGQAVPDLDRHLARGDLEILGHDEWYLHNGQHDPQTVLRAWHEKLNQALAAGYAGLRACGDGGWVHKDEWIVFREYEKKLDALIADQCWIILCTYPLTTSPGNQIFDVAHVHRLAVARRHGNWEIIETPELKQAKAEIKRLNEELEQKVGERPRELATTNEALGESEERFRRYFELGLIGMAITSPTKGCIEVNDEFCRVLGYERSELLRMTWVELTHPDDLAADVAHFNRVLAGEIDGYSMDKRFIRKNGQVIDTTISVKCLRRADRSVDYFVALAQDITERKRAEERLRKVGAQLADAQRLSHVGSWEWDITTDTVIWSDEQYRLMGLEPQEAPVTYASFLNGLHPDDRARIDEAVQQALRDHQPFSCDYRMILPNGKVRLQHVEGTVDTDESGRPVRMIGTTQDITERKLADEALRESDTRFRQLAENINQVFWLSNPEGTLIHYVSPAYEKIWGRSCDNLYAEPASWMDAIHPDDRERIAEAERLQLIRGEHDHSYRIIRRDGSLRWIRDRAFPVRDESGTLIRVAGLAEDITARKEAERKIEHFADLFQTLSHHLLNIQEEERRHLARELHDEIGQTLTAAKLNLKVMASEVPPAVAGRLEDSIRILDRLLQQVRQLSLDLHPPLLDDLGLVPALRWLADQQAQRAGFRVTFTTNVEGLEMGPSLRTACFRVAQEAITNALRHAQAVTVSVELRAESDRVWLVVHDDGAGFDTAAMQQRAAGGASLGLLSMNERVALVGGELELNSAPGRGTEIRAWFPLAPSGPAITS